MVLLLSEFPCQSEKQPEGSIAKQCLQISKDMADKRKKKSLMLKVSDLCNKSNLHPLNLTENNSSSFISQVRLTLNKEVTQHQLNLIKHNKKLIFYSMFKTDCHKADFLNTINNPSHKKAMNKLRLGNHRLRIETGRHTIPKTPENLRICPFCHLNEVENELHFILSCHLYNNLRLKFFEDINRKYHHFDVLDDKSKILFLFNNVDPFICRLTAAFIHSCMDYRQNVTT
jgi:hypothetical protein